MRAAAGMVVATRAGAQAVARTSGALDRHSTRAVALKPSALVAAAVADLALREAKQLGQCERGRPYLFCRRHVQRASYPLDLIDRAIRDRYSGIYSSKRPTRLVYLDEELLWAARALCSPVGGKGDAE